jgi:serine/threonine protein kinase
MAPEVFSQRYSTPADLWSFGVILYVLLTGHLPEFDPNNFAFPLNRVTEMLAAVPRALAAEALTGAPPAAVDLLLKVLEPDPARRLTASAALAHAWFLQGDNVTPGPERFMLCSASSLLAAQRSTKKSEWLFWPAEIPSRQLRDPIPAIAETPSRLYEPVYDREAVQPVANCVAVGFTALRDVLLR